MSEMSRDKGIQRKILFFAKKFIERIECATQREGYSLWRRVVKYVDSSVFDIRMMSEEIDVAFHKGNYILDATSRFFKRL